MHVGKCLGEDTVEDFNISILDRKQRIWRKGKNHGGGWWWFRYADDLGYVPISSVRGKPCVIPQAVEVSELFGRR